MEYPHHHHRHHDRRNDDDDDEGEYYPPPGTAPPPPPLQHRNPNLDYDQTTTPPPFHQPPSYFHPDTNYPLTPMPRPPYHYPESTYDPYGPPPPPQVAHVSHDQVEPHSRHSFRPHLPSFHHHQGDAPHPPPGLGLDLSIKPTWKVYCKAGPDLHLTIRDGKVVLAPSDPSDVYQNWFKDEKYSTRVKDEEGCPCFALVNKATTQAMKHSIGASHPVQLIPYNPDVLDESILWTESKDLGDGYRAVRMVNNVHLNVDAFHGDKKSGGVHDGTTIVLWEWNKGDNQQWKIYPLAK